MITPHTHLAGVYLSLTWDCLAVLSWRVSVKVLACSTVFSLLKETLAPFPNQQLLSTGASGGSLAAAAVACNVDLAKAMALYRAESAVMLRDHSWYRGGSTDMLYKVNTARSLKFSLTIPS
jgi:hypothetical protein